MIVGVLVVAGVSASPQLVPQNNCVSFSVGPGTGCRARPGPGPRGSIRILPVEICRLFFI